MDLLRREVISPAAMMPGVDIDSDVTIIGAGAAGIMTAIMLPEDVRITVFETGEEILPSIGTSSNGSDRIHTGLHYAGDLATARRCLEKSVGLARHFPQFMLAGEDDAPWKRARHYVMSNSLISPDEVRSVALNLQAYYNELVEQDPKNQVFGLPRDFFREIPLAEIPYLADQVSFEDQLGRVSQQSVICVFEVVEFQLDLAALKDYFNTVIRARRNITFVPNTRVMSIEPHPDYFGYVVRATKKDRTCVLHSTNTLVNCAWHEIERLNETAGFEHEDNRVNRMKISIVVDWPEFDEKIPSGLWSIGPYCSMTIFPNKLAILTSERTTNIAHFKVGLQTSDDEIALHSDKINLDCEEGRNIANKILRECASFLKSPYKERLEATTIRKIRRGFVKMTEQVSEYKYKVIFEKDSEIHARIAHGVERLGDFGPGYFVNASLKFIFMYSNALKLCPPLLNDLRLIQQLNELYNQVKYELQSLLTHDVVYDEELDVFLQMSNRTKLKKILESQLAIYSSSVEPQTYSKDLLLSCAKNIVKILRENYIRPKITLENLFELEPSFKSLSRYFDSFPSLSPRTFGALNRGFFSKVEDHEAAIFNQATCTTPTVK